MDSEAELRTLQEQELESIVAIFGDAVADLRHHDEHKSLRPPEVFVKCLPQSSESHASNIHYVSVSLHIKLSAAYPKHAVNRLPRVPVLFLKDAKGLSDRQIEQLTRDLTSLRSQLLGHEMLYELIQYTQAYLYKNNKPPAQSFYDQRLSHKQKELDDKRREEEEIERKQLEEIQEYIRNQEEEIKQEEQRRLETQAKPSDVLTKLLPASEITDTSSSAEITKCENPDHQTLKEVNFQIGKITYNVMKAACIKHDVHGSVLFSAYDTSKGSCYAIRQWTINLPAKRAKDRADELVNKCSRFWSPIEQQELPQLKKVKESSLIQYISVKFFKEDHRILLMVLTEAHTGLSLTQFVQLPCTDNVHMIQHIGCQLTRALQYLHALQVVHKDLKPDFVHIASNQVKISDYSLYRKINDIYDICANNKPESQVSAIKRSQKDDIYRLGLILLFMITKTFDENDRQPKIPASTDALLQDLLNRCLIIDEKARWTAAQLVTHNFFTSSAPHRDNRRSPSPEAKANKAEAEDDDVNLLSLKSSDSNTNSRLSQEFDILDIIGKGGFGEVLKVRNRLDGQLYAIKRIMLDPRSLQRTNRRITREVKLLSKLNHENVVRYYTSWIETIHVQIYQDDLSETVSTTTTNNTTTEPELLKRKLHDILEGDSIEKNAPPAVSGYSNWSSHGSDDMMLYAESESESSSSDDEIYERKRQIHSSDDANITFENSSKSHQAQQCDDSELSHQRPHQVTRSSPLLHQQIMYIQMEFCEKNTLRQVIDSGLYLDLSRVWRLYREIVEGLAHVHEQGFIHRDLKPVNIFLDSNDHVKIGDFGLATTSLKNTLVELEVEAGLRMDDLPTSQSASVTDGGHTGRVGTLFYLSPEIKSSSGKVTYSQKVDIYSLGIIFFEMCYQPLPTLMEREKIIGNLRKADIVFPDDFLSNPANAQQVSILRWTLDHDPEKRPSCQQILQSSYLPPPQKEQERFDELIRSSIANPQTRNYKKLISEIFSARPSRKFDFSYDHNVHKGINIRSLVTRKLVKQKLDQICRRHGAIELDLPLMLPKLSLYECYDDNVTLMDHAGNLVCLPSDNMVPFARFVARNNIRKLKKYSVSRSFHERKPHGIQPHERWIFDFHIVSPSKDTVVPDSELVVVIQEILSELSSAGLVNYIIYASHVLLTKAILLHHGIPITKHNEVLSALAECKNKSSWEKMQSYTSSDHLRLLQYLDMKNTFNNTQSFLRSITKQSTEAAAFAKAALHELESFITNSKELGLTIPIHIDLGFISDHMNCSGIKFYVLKSEESSSTAKGQSVADTLAVGYRYDGLVNQFKLESRKDDVRHTPGAIGMWMRFDRLSQIYSSDKEGDVARPCDVILVTQGRQQKELLRLAKSLWSQKIHTDIVIDSSAADDSHSDDGAKLLKEYGTRFCVVLDDFEPSMAVLYAAEQERVTEKKYQIENIVNILVERIRPVITNSRSAGTESSNSNHLVARPQNSEVQRSVADANINPSNSTRALTLLLINEQSKTPLKLKTKYENQIFAHLSSSLNLLKKPSEAEVVAVELAAAEVKVLAYVYGQSDDEDHFSKTWSVELEKQGSASKRKYMLRIFERLTDIKFKNKPAVLIIYGLKDDSFKYII